MKLTRRKVKGRPYYYLEKTMRMGENKWKTIYFYAGPQKPSAARMAELKKKLALKVNAYINTEIVKENTEFIDKKTALKLERIKNSHARLLGGMGRAGRAAWLARQRAQFITNTNAIEGSRVSLDQTRKILGLRKAYEAGKDELEVLNMESCLEAYDRLLEKGVPVDEEMVLGMHLTLLKAIPGYGAHCGTWRNVDVFIRTSRYAFPAWKEVPGLMAHLFRWYESNRGRMHPVELAAKFHARLVTIHPFADGNGRMARLLMNYILQSNGFPFVDIPYEKRDEYFETQERAHFGDFRPFVNFLVRQIFDDYKRMKTGNRR